MAFEQFIPEIWMGNVLTGLEKAHVYGGVANRNYEGEIKDFGDTVKILFLGDVAVSTYSSDSTTISYPDLSDAQRELKIDQQKYFSFGLNDVNVAQSKPGVREQAMQRATYNLRDASDQYLAGLYTDAGITNGLGTESVPLSITSVSVVEYFGLLGQKMTENNVPLEGRWAIIPPWLHEKMRLAKINFDTSNSTYLASNYVGAFNGFQLYMSNNVSTATPASNAGARVMAGVAETITFAEQVVKMEALRLESKFKDGIRGLYVYGAKVVRPETLACLRCSYAVEP